jgi:hypothetical protein
MGGAARPVAEEHGVLRVLPALVLEALRSAGGVGHVAAHAVGVLEHPGQRQPGGALELADELFVGGPAPDLVQEDQEERGSVHRAVVGGLRYLCEVGELPAPELVRDLPGLRVPEVVPLGGLVPGERPERVLRRLGAEYHGLVARDQGVPPEEGHEPRRPRRRHQQASPGVEGERLEVLEARLPAPAQRLPPRLQPRRPRVERRVPRKPDPLATLLQLHRDAHGAGLLGLEMHLEREAPELRARRDPLPLDAHDGPPQEPASPVGEPQPPVLRLLQDLAAPGRLPPAPQLEDVPEVRGALDLAPDLDGNAGLVGEQDLLFHAAPQKPPPHHVHALRPHAGGHRELSLRTPHLRRQRDHPRPPDP